MGVGAGEQSAGWQGSGRTAWAPSPLADKTARVVHQAKTGAKTPQGMGMTERPGGKEAVSLRDITGERPQTDPGTRNAGHKPWSNSFPGQVSCSPQSLETGRNNIQSNTDNTVAPNTCD